MQVCARMCVYASVCSFGGACTCVDMCRGQRLMVSSITSSSYLLRESLSLNVNSVSFASLPGYDPLDSSVAVCQDWICGHMPCLAF